MPNRKFEIQVASSFDPAGTQQAAQGFGKLGEAGKKSGETIFESHHEVHKLIHAIGNDALPGMGEAMAALSQGPLGALVAVGLAVEFIKNKIEETNKRLDEMSASASKAFGGGDALTDYVKAAAEAASQTEAIAEALKKASDQGSEVTNRYTAQAKAIQEIVEALKAKLKAEGKDVPGEVLDTAEAQALQNGRQRELAERQANQPSLQSAAETAVTSDSVLQTRAARATELDAQKAALAKATSEMNTAANDELKEQVENNQALLEQHRKQYGSSDPLGFAKRMQDETDQLESQTAEARAEAARKKIAELSSQTIKDQDAAAKEKAAREEATNAASENEKRIVQLQKDIADANTAAQIKAASSPKLIGSLQPNVDAKTFEQLAGVDSPAGASTFVQQFSESQSRLMHHQGTGQDSDTIRLMNQLLQSSRQSDQGMFQILTALIQQHGATNNRIDALWKQLQTMRSASSRNSPTGQ